MSSKKISIRFALVAFALLFSQLASAHLSAEGAPAVQEGAPMHSLQGGVGQGSAEIFRIYAFPVAAAVSRSSEFTVKSASENFSTLSARFEIRIVQTEDEHEVFSTSIYGENPSFTYAFNDGSEHRMEATMVPLDASAPATYKYLLDVQPQQPTPELQARVLLALAGVFFTGALMGVWAGNARKKARKQSGANVPN